MVNIWSHVVHRWMCCDDNWYNVPRDYGVCMFRYGNIKLRFHSKGFDW